MLTCTGRAVQHHFTETADASVQQNLAEWIVALVTQVLTRVMGDTRLIGAWHTARLYR